MALLQESDPSKTPVESSHNSEVACAEYALRNASINHWPFSHALIRPVMSAGYYREMVESFPEDDAFTPLSSFYPDRGAVYLTPDREDGNDDLSRLDPNQRAFWAEFVEMFGGERFRKVLLETLGGLELVESHLSRTHSLIHLSLDRVGYQIQPHTDIATKIVTAIFYLPEDDAAVAKFGTSILVEREGKAGLDRRDWARYETAFTAPFLENTLFAFKVGDSSWHGVRPIDHPIRRRSVQFFVMLDFD